LARANHEVWGRYVESAVGAHLLNHARIEGFEVYYWRESNKEVDFVLQKGPSTVAIEVKSGFKRGKLAGLKALKGHIPELRTYVLSQDKLQDYFSSSPSKYFDLP